MEGGRGGEGHARRGPCCSSTFCGHRGRRAGGGGFSGQPSHSAPNRSFWRPVNAHGGHHHQKAVSQPNAATSQHVPIPVPRPQQHHGEPSKGFSAQYDDSTNVNADPRSLAGTSTAHPSLDEQNRDQQATPGELEVAPYTPVQLDLKQQPLQREVLQQTRKDAAGSSQLNYVNPHVPSQVKASEEPILHQRLETQEEQKLEEVNLRQLNAILNKLTTRNFEKLFAKVEKVNIDNMAILKWFISQIFYRVLMEPTFSEIYANFCFHLAGFLPDFSEHGEKFTFKRLLLNKCQEEFERGEREEAEDSKSVEGGRTKEESEATRIRARRRMLGNIRFIGELYKRRMLTERIMHECIKKLIGDFHNPDEEKVEGLCTLMSTIGEKIDHPKAEEHMDAYFDMMQKLSTSQNLSWRVRFLLRDLIDLRKNKWQQRCKMISFSADIWGSLV